MMQVMRCFASFLASCLLACVRAFVLTAWPRTRDSMSRTMGEKQAVLAVSKASRERPLMREKARDPGK